MVGISRNDGIEGRRPQQIGSLCSRALLFLWWASIVLLVLNLQLTSVASSQGLSVPLPTHWLPCSHAPGTGRQKQAAFCASGLRFSNVKELGVLRLAPCPLCASVVFKGVRADILTYFPRMGCTCGGRMGYRSYIRIP